MGWALQGPGCLEALCRPLLGHLRRLEDRQCHLFSCLGVKTIPKRSFKKRNDPGQTEITGHFQILPWLLQRPRRRYGKTQAPCPHPLGAAGCSVPFPATSSIHHCFLKTVCAQGFSVWVCLFHTPSPRSYVCPSCLLITRARALSFWASRFLQHPPPPSP